jgi:3-phosphoshikimate 1-carboxyvinyltransferase
MLNALATGSAVVRGLPSGRDVRSTVEALSALGVEIDPREGNAVKVGEAGDWSTDEAIDCGNSGTTARLLLGVLAGRARRSVELTGDASLRSRPMLRVIEPLRAMGAEIRGGTAGDDHLPVTVEGKPLRGRPHSLAVASAQVKTALLLAGLVAEGETVVEEPEPSRDHTERLLASMGAAIEREGSRITIRPGPIEARDIDVPGDLSSAAPFLTLAATRPGNTIVVEEVGLNPTRAGFLEVLEAFGAQVETTVTGVDPEPWGTVRVTGAPLTAVEVGGSTIPRMIDEVPLVAVLGAIAEGRTRVWGAAELRVKESDRVEAITAGLAGMGVSIEATADGLEVQGPARLHGARLDAVGDHRIGMALAIAATLADGESGLSGDEWVDVSYPGFFDDLARCCNAGVTA